MEFLFDCGRAFCHQLPYKSFYIADKPFWLCARCTGIYLGAFTVLVGAVLSRWNTRLSFDRRWWIYVMTTAGLLAADLMIGLWRVQGWVVPRFVTGYLFGAAATAGGLSFLIRRLDLTTRVKSVSSRGIAGLVGLLVIWIGVIGLLTPVTWGPGTLSVPVVAGLLMFWGIWNSILFVLIFPRLPVRQGYRSFTLAWGAGLLMFFAEASVAWWSN